MHHAPPSCPGCGSPASPDAARCAYCSRRLARLACPACFATTFDESQFCSRCGATLARAEAAAPPAGPCPRCRSALRRVRVGDTALDECERCDGVWLDAATFEGVCRDRERRATLLLRAGGGAVAPSGADAVRYLACPTCAGLMNRVNYARASGVIVDVCKTHGVWLDAGELPRLAAFVDGGGVDRVREREREQLAAERRQLELARAATAGARHDVEWPSAAASTRAADRSVDVLALVVRLLDDA